jgi:hypothetical protein
MQNKIDILLEGSYSDIETKLYYLIDVFKLMSLKSFGKDTYQWMEDQRDNYEIIDIYLEYINTLEMSLFSYTNIKTLDDVVKLKKMLQEWFIQETTTEKLKMIIIEVLSNFVQVTDYDFFKNVISNYLLYSDFYIANVLLSKSIKSLQYIDNIKSDNVENKGFYIDTSKGNNENAMIKYNKAVFFSWSASNLDSDFVLSDYVKLVSKKHLDKYVYINPLFSLLNGKDVGCKIQYDSLYIKDGRLKLHFLLSIGEQDYINESDIDALLFLESIGVR